MRFQIYSRKSVFTGRGESVENQVEMCRAYIFAHFPGTEEEDLAVYEDEGYSGKDLDRPQFQRMLRDMVRERPDCLVCYRLDRISRSVGDFAGLIGELDRLGVAFICIRERFDTGSPMGKAMMYIASVFAQLERETIAQRVRDNMLMLARTGRWLGGTPPLGYRSERAGEVVVDGKVRTACRLRAHPAEGETVELIFRKFLELQSLNGLRKYLHRAGVRSRTGGDYSLPGLREILQNPVYCASDEDALAYFLRHKAEVCFTPEAGGRGLLAYNKRDYAGTGSPRNPVEKWIVAAGRHESRVSGRDWVAVQEILERNRPGCPRSNPRNGYALLSGLIVCARCGGRMFAKVRSGDRSRFDYVCQRKAQLGRAACGCPNLPGKGTDDLVCARLAGPARPGAALAELVDGLRAELPVRRVRPDPEGAGERRDLTGFDGMDLAERRDLIRLLVADCRWDGSELRLDVYGEDPTFSLPEKSP